MPDSMPGVQKRFSEKQTSQKVRFKGADHSMHMKDGVPGKGGKDGKVQYADIGEKSQFGPPGSKEKHYPSMHLAADKLKDLHDHAPGDEVEMHVKGKVKGHDVDDKGQHHYHVEVTHAAVKK
jgi:hypothetical protein